MSTGTYGTGNSSADNTYGIGSFTRCRFGTGPVRWGEDMGGIVLRSCSGLPVSYTLPVEAVCFRYTPTSSR